MCAGQARKAVTYRLVDPFLVVGTENGAEFGEEVFPCLAREMFLGQEGFRHGAVDELRVSALHRVILLLKPPSMEDGGVLDGRWRRTTDLLLGEADCPWDRDFFGRGKELGISLCIVHLLPPALVLLRCALVVVAVQRANVALPWDLLGFLVPHQR